MPPQLYPNFMLFLKIILGLERISTRKVRSIWIGLFPHLNAAIEKFAALATEVKEVIAAIADNPAPSIADAFATIKALRHVAVVPKQGRSVLTNPTWARDLAVLETAIEHGEQLASFIRELDDYFRPEAWSCDTASLLLALRADGESFFRRFQ